METWYFPRTYLITILHRKTAFIENTFLFHIIKSLEPNPADRMHTPHNEAIWQAKCKNVDESAVEQ